MAVITVVVVTCADGQAQASYTYNDQTKRVTSLDAANQAPLPLSVQFTYVPTGDTQAQTLAPGATYHLAVNLPLSLVQGTVSEILHYERYPA